MMPLSAIVEGDTSCSSSSEGEEELIEEEDEMGNIIRGVGYVS